MGEARATDGARGNENRRMVGASGGRVRASETRATGNN
jgi:hypothetical protein